MLNMNINLIKIIHLKNYNDNKHLLRLIDNKYNS